LVEADRDDPELMHHVGALKNLETGLCVWWIQDLDSNNLIVDIKIQDTPGDTSSDSIISAWMTRGDIRRQLSRQPSVS
jgi:hypothetical protein